MRPRPISQLSQPQSQSLLRFQSLQLLRKSQSHQFYHQLSFHQLQFQSFHQYRKLLRREKLKRKRRKKK